VTSTLHLILRCDTGTREDRCPGYFIGSAGLNIEEVRTAAHTAKGWTFKPGSPYRHIGATDLCPQHSTPAPVVDAVPAH
jgi:hypothetical protein